MGAEQETDVINGIGRELWKAIRQEHVDGDSALITG